MAATNRNPAASRLDGMPRSNNANDRMAIQICRKLELEEAIKKNMLKEKREITALEEAVNMLDNPAERQVIRMRYFDMAPWAEICDSVFGDRPDFQDRRETYKRRTYWLHGSALQHLSENQDNGRK